MLTCILTILEVMCSVKMSNHTAETQYTTTVGNILYNVGNFETIASKSSYMPQYTKN